MVPNLTLCGMVRFASLPALSPVLAAAPSPVLAAPLAPSGSVPVVGLRWKQICRVACVWAAAAARRAALRANISRDEEGGGGEGGARMSEGEEGERWEGRGGGVSEGGSVSGEAIAVFRTEGR